MPESVWEVTMPADARVAAGPLPGETTTDVVIVGAGLTGLWTAYYLAAADPALRIVVVDAATIGFGASGRSGGWCSGFLPMSLSTMSDRHGRYGAVAMQRAMYDTVGEVGRILAAEGADAGFRHGGTLSLARTAAQEERLRADLAEARQFGFGEEDVRWLGAGDVASRCAATNVRGALFSPHCAAVQPLRLVHAVATAAVARRVQLYERTRVTAVRPRAVDTEHGKIRAEVVVLATEAYTVELPGRRRDVIPLYSLMVATEPLDDERWASIGLAGRETFSDGRHLIIYGQRTADGRLAFGGRGAPYHFGSRIDPRFDTDERIRSRLVQTARELFPVLGDVAFPFHWGGPLGVPRDWHAAVRFELGTRMASAGGYVGDGVATANLAGRTLADLITGQHSELCDLPWVGYHSRPWEREPLRWIGVNAARVAAARADRAERRSGRLAATRAAVWRRTLASLTRR